MNQLYTRTRAWLLAVLLLGVSLRAAAQNTWTQKANFGGSGRGGAVAFSIGSKGYLGTGIDNAVGYTKDFWEYDPAADTWTQKADFGGTERWLATGFSIGSKGYLGTGDTYYGLTKDFWEYNPATNNWTQKADYGGSVRQGAVGFSIGGKGYLGTGYDTDYNPSKDFWEYDPATDIWTKKADFAGSGRVYAAGFSIGSKGYLGTGSDGYYLNATSDFWEYNPATNAWAQKADFGGSARIAAVGFSISSKGYLSMGSSSNEQIKDQDFWEYDPATNAWAQKANFGGSARYVAVGFSIGSKGYLGTGVDNSIGHTKDFWEYSPVPSCQAPTNVAVAGITTTTASVSFAGSSTASGGYTVSYTPSGSPTAQTVAGSASPVALTGLAPNTTYTVTVTSNCAGTQTATSTPAVRFTTLCEKPVLTAPASQTVAATTGQCGASVAFAGSATGTPAPTLVYTLPGGQVISSPYVFAVGTTTVTATASSCGGTDSKTFTVTVQDKQAPTVRTQNISVALVNGTATITAAQANGGSSDNCSGTLRYSVSPSTFSCANIGPNTVTLTVTDASGNQASGPATVTVTGSIPVPTISVTPATTVYTGGVATTLYLGYGSQSATLTASGAGPNGTYRWSPATGLSSSTIANPVFTATTAGTFAYTVTATSASGCSATKSVTLTVVDARCSSNGKKLDKVLVCHHGSPLCIGTEGVADHLAHGDPLGDCPASKTSAQPASLARTQASPTTDGEASTSLEAYPNPFSSSTTLRFRAAQAGAAQVRVYNALGQLVATLYDGQLQAGELVERTLSSTGLSTGLYTCRYVAPGGEYLTQRVTLTK